MYCAMTSPYSPPLHVLQRIFQVDTADKPVKPVGDWISAPSQNVVDPQTMTDSVTRKCKFFGVNFGC